MKHGLSLGSYVRNLGVVAKVVGFHSGTGDPILREPYTGQKWLASANLCEPVKDYALVSHKDGLAAFC